MTKRYISWEEVETLVNILHENILESGEDFDTNIEAIDTDMDLASGPITTLTLANTPTLRDFVIGEKVFNVALRRETD